MPAVLNFWLNEVGPQGWYDAGEEMDVRLTHMFRALWEAQKGKPVSEFLADADTALAAIVLFDQFPRNMFRHEARAFATDPLALEIAKAAIERGYDDEFVAGAQSFFYLPFMHSENLADQDRCIALFDRPGLRRTSSSPICTETSSPASAASTPEQGRSAARPGRKRKLRLPKALPGSQHPSAISRVHPTASTKRGSWLTIISAPS